MSASTNIVRLLDMVRIAAPGALDGMIRMECFNTLKEFFQRSDAWLLELPLYVIPVVNDYQLETGQNVVVNRLMAVGRPDNPVTPLPPYAPTCPPQFYASSDLDTLNEGQNPLFRSPREGVLLNAGVKCPILRITQNPSANETWIVIVSLTPCDPVDSDGFVEPPGWAMEKYLKGMASGVICSLMLQPGKPYSSLKGAEYHGRKFNEAVGLARTEVRRMFVYGGQNWQFPGGWNAPRPRLPTSGTLG
jgi:hypothetical protein